MQQHIILMGLALAEGGKVLLESDPEVSEAVDFCRYYALAAESIAASKEVRARGLGVVAVIPPWNFPIAIPCGGIAAALAAGNTVILKPAPETVATAWHVCQCFWSAGIGKHTLQFSARTTMQRRISRPTAASTPWCSPARSAPAGASPPGAVSA